MALRLVTHNGSFHADDVMAYAILSMAIPGKHDLVRTRDKSAINKGDIVWDVGFEYNPNNFRYDHHQKNSPERDDGVPYSSAGLVWKYWGKKAVEECLLTESNAIVKAVVEYIDEKIIRKIDLIDNGLMVPEDSLGITALVGDYNLCWDVPDEGKDEAEDRAFIEASNQVSKFLIKRIDAIRARVLAQELVIKSAFVNPNPLILELERWMPWKEVVQKANLPVVYAVYPSSNGEGWRIDTMPPPNNNLSQKLPLPAEWAGLEGQELQKITGIKDAIFVHRGRFMAAADSREGAMKMAEMALDIGYGTKNLFK